MKAQLDQKIEEAFDKQNWEMARHLLEVALREEPNDHWLLTRLSTTYYEQGDYKKALEVSHQAMKQDPECPLVLWDHACALDMSCNSRAAIKVWQHLLKRGIEVVAKDACSEGQRWTKALLNDCRFRIAMAYADLGNSKKALKFLRDHRTCRQRGIPSLYDLSEVDSAITRLAS